MPDAASSKPHFGAPIGNKNAQKHGLYAKDAGRVDLRRREDRAVSNALRAIEEDLGGSALSAQERIILANLGRRLKDLFKIDAYLDTLSSIANKRSRTLWPVVAQKHAILDAIRRDLESLGLRRRAREGPSLADIAAEYANKGDEAKEGRESSSLAAADLSTASDSADKTNTVAPCESCETCERSLVGETAEGGGS
jgi:hypothetical protein